MTYKSDTTEQSGPKPLDVSSTAETTSQEQLEYLGYTSGTIDEESGLYWNEETTVSASEEYIESIYKEMSIEIHQIDRRLAKTESNIAQIKKALNDTRNASKNEILGPIFFWRPQATLYALGVIVFMTAFYFANPLIGLAGAAIVVGTTLHYGS